MGRRHLILGGCGFIGRHVALALARSGHDVVLADRVPAPEFPADCGGRITAQHAEIGAIGWDRLIEDVDVIHHYAWASIPASANDSPAGDLETNLLPTLALLDALKRRGHGTIVFTSSGGTVYGKLDSPPAQESMRLAPINAYAAGKATAELYLTVYRALYGLDSRIARVSNPYGAGQNIARGQGAASKFVHASVTGQPIEIWGDGSVVRDYIHVADVVSGLMAIAEAADLGEERIFNIGSGAGTNLNTLAAAVGETTGHPLTIAYTPGRSFDIPVSVLDVGLAERVLGWKPVLDLETGLAWMMEDLRAGREFSQLHRR